MGTREYRFGAREDQMTIEYVGDGRIRAKNYEIVITDAVRSPKLAGYQLASDIVEQLVDRDVENIVFVDLNRGRYTISLEDWLDYRVWDEITLNQHVAQSHMDRG